MYKIAIIIRKLNISGGVQRHALWVAKEYLKRGHRVKFYTFRYEPELCYPEIIRDFDVVSLNFEPRLRAGSSKLAGYLNYFFNLGAEARAAKLLSEKIDQDTDILNPHDHVCYKVAYFFKKSVKNIPSIWMIHDLPNKRFSFLRAQALNPELELPLLKRFVYWLTDAYDSRKYVSVQNRLVVLGKRDQELARRYFKKEALVVNNGLSLEDFEFRKRIALPGKSARLLMNGIFMPHRRFEDGIRAVKILTDAHYDIQLRITGDYENNQSYYLALRKLVNILGIADRVEFSHTISDQEVKESYRTSDIFLFPNHFQSWGLAVFEALASGLPAIVSQSAGAAQVLTDGENALLVKPLSPESLASNIKMLIANPDLYSRLSISGREFVEDNISWSKLAQAMLKIFASVV